MRGCEFKRDDWVVWPGEPQSAMYIIGEVAQWLGFESSAAYGKALDEEGPFIWDRLNV